MNLPKALLPGDRVGVVAPSGRVDPAALDRGLAELRTWGLEPAVGRHVLDGHGYLAATDAGRAADLMWAFQDPSLAGIICARGGYGCLRLLPLLDWDVIRAHPKVFAGFSDITTLHQAFWKEAGLVTFHAPMLSAAEPEGMPRYNAEGLRGALFGTAYPGPAPLPDAPDAPALRTLVGGTARGRLLGGNLELVTRNLGTPWQLDTRGAILVLEDVDEAPYRVDRMLMQLKVAGLLDGVAGIVFGHSPTCEQGPEGRPSLTLFAVLEELLVPLGVPLLYGFPCGHSKYRATLPLGCQAELDAGAGRLTILERATRA